MIKQFLKRLVWNKKKHDPRFARTNWLADYLGARGEIVLDKYGMQDLTKSGFTRKQIFQSIYDLILARRIQMSTNSFGNIVIKSEVASKSNDVEDILLEGFNNTTPAVATAEENDNNPDSYLLSDEQIFFTVSATEKEKNQHILPGSYKNKPAAEK